MKAIVWSDYRCPWCYLGLDRTALLEILGVRVTARPYELPMSPARRAPAAATRIAAACAEAGLPLRWTARMPSTRRAHETVEVVRRVDPKAAALLHRLLFAAHFAEGLAIDEPSVLDELVAAAGADAVAVRSAVEANQAAGVVEASMDAAHEAGAAGVPAWLIDGRLLLPGVQPREMYERMVKRLRERPAT